MSAECSVELIRIVNYLAEELSPTDRDEFATHLETGCATCKERLNSLNPSVEIPALEPSSRLLLAQPLLDTRMFAPRTVGVRGGATLTRRRVYESEGRICIDIQQHEDEPGTSTLEGQVLIRGGDLGLVADSVVALWQTGVQITETRVDSLGDFSIPQVPAGVYDLMVAFGQSEVMVRGIEV